MKICGLTHADDLRHCLALGIDFVGFNFYPGSKRYVTPAAARSVWTAAVAAWQSRTPTQPRAPATRPVAVMVDATPSALAEALAAFPDLAAVQFHGQETPALLQSLRSVLGARAVWRAVAVSSAEDVASAAAYAVVPAGAATAAADFVLFDSGRIPAGAMAPGGSGSRFDWQWLGAWRGPFGVAGGLRPGLVAAAVETGARLLDLSSGVEAGQPGRKDPGLVEAVWQELQAAVRTADER